MRRGGGRVLPRPLLRRSCAPTASAGLVGASGYTLVKVDPATGATAPVGEPITPPGGEALASWYGGAVYGDAIDSGAGSSGGMLLQVRRWAKVCAWGALLAPRHVPSASLAGAPESH